MNWVRLQHIQNDFHEKAANEKKYARQSTNAGCQPYTSFITMRTLRATLPPSATRDLETTLASVANTSVKCSPSLEVETENALAGYSQKISMNCKGLVAPKSKKNSTGCTMSPNFEAQNVFGWPSNANAAPSKQTYAQDPQQIQNIPP